MSKPQEKAWIHVGASRDAVMSARSAILSILAVRHSEERTKRVALRALVDLCRSDHTTITNCTFGK